MKMYVDNLFAMRIVFTKLSVTEWNINHLIKLIIKILDNFILYKLGIELLKLK